MSFQKEAKYKVMKQLKEALYWAEDTGDEELEKKVKETYRMAESRYKK